VLGPGDRPRGIVDGPRGQRADARQVIGDAEVGGVAVALDQPGAEPLVSGRVAGEQPE